MYDILTINNKKTIISNLINKLNNRTLRHIYNYAVKNNIPITKTQYYYLFDINKFNDLMIDEIFTIIMKNEY